MSKFDERYPHVRPMIRYQIETWDIEMATEHLTGEFAAILERECAKVERETILREHELLATLDEKGRNERYLRLAQEGKKRG